MTQDQTTDYRALCAELLSRLEESDDYILKEEGTIALADRARAALAEPMGEGVTDEELWDIGERHLWTGTDESVTNYRILTSFIEAARAVLARFGTQQ